MVVAQAVVRAVAMSVAGKAARREVGESLAVAADALVGAKKGVGVDSSQVVSVAPTSGMALLASATPLSEVTPMS